MTRSPETTVDADGLARLLDERALTELVTRSCRGVDRCDTELILSCYHPDAREDHGPFQGGTREEFAADVVRRHIGRWVTQHTVTNMRFEIAGDVALGETYVMQRTMGPDDAPAFAWGRYIDRFERREGEWRIARRRVLVEGASPSQGIPLDPSASRQDREDPSYLSL